MYFFVCIFFSAPCLSRYHGQRRQDNRELKECMAIFHIQTGWFFFNLLSHWKKAKQKTIRSQENQAAVFQYSEEK